MVSLALNQNLLTGISDVDEQHLYLIEVIQRFSRTLKSGEELSQEDLDQLTVELVSYSEYHFAAEEKLMREKDIAAKHYGQHVQEHRSFLDEVTRMLACVRWDNPKGNQNLLYFLIHWLTYHICGSDLTMANQIKAIEEGKSPQEAFDTSIRKTDPATAILLNALNGMFTEVSASNRALFKLNQSLEAMVAERTKELSAANARLELIAMTDQLTGLPNRRYALCCFEEEWKRSSEMQTPISCMMMDADGFKRVNDSYGHEAGDEVLQQLASCLRDTIDVNYILCRLGGDELLVICPQTTLETALDAAEVMRSAVAQLRVPVGDGYWLGSVSIGVAERIPEMKGYGDLMRQADEAVYVAKRNGRNCVASLVTAL